jgi:glycosyltransferase involved in cell wall biosynthesis
VKVRLYQTGIGEGSFARVGRGVRQALLDLGVLAGSVPVDALDPEAVYPGHDAEVGVFIANPTLAGVMTQIGWHKERWVLLPVNSTYVPQELVGKLEREGVTGWIAPSAWAQGILAAATRKPVLLWPHGVGLNFQPDLQEHLARLEEYETDRRFHVLHFASTTLQRKGTRELVAGWVLAKRQGLLPPYATLQLFIEGSGERIAEILALADGDLSVRAESSRGSFSERAMAAAYRSAHAVAQPSRGEGFGLPCLESAACGTPILMTNATGHTHYAGALVDPAGDVACGVIAWVGELTPIDDGPGALAPSLAPTEVAAALGELHKHWMWFQHDAWSQSPNLHLYFSWRRGTEGWLEQREQWLDDQKERQAT